MDTGQKLRFLVLGGTDHIVSRLTSGRFYHSSVRVPCTSHHLPGEKSYENVLEVLKDLDFEFEEEVNKIFSIIDELFIQRLAENKKMYYELLDELKREILNIEDL